MNFRINLKFIVDKHSIFHILGSVMVYWLFRNWFNIFYSGLLTFFVGLFWEISDGLKKDWHDYQNENIISLLFYADGFSWSDILMNMVGIFFCIGGENIV